jgi:guanylate kinase
VIPGSRPFALVIAAPSGAGKTSLARAIVERSEDVVFSLSATTRPPRPGERHDEDYHFVDETGFDRLIAADALLEWATVHGRRYGTLRSGVQAALDAGRTVVLDIDVQGARKVRSVLPDAVLLFVLPPSVAEMTRRLKGRGSGEDAAEVAKRMRTARSELELEVVRDFDYIIVNDEFDATVARIESVIAAELGSVARVADLQGTLALLRRDIDEYLQGSD